jgi:PRTRC genetic system protein C
MDNVTTSAPVQMQQLKRVFMFKDQRFEDPDPQSRPEEVIELLSALEPELAVGYIKSSESNPENDSEIVYQIGTNIGTKA